MPGTLEQWLGAIFLIMMIFYLARNYRRTKENTPEAKEGDWPAALLAIAVVIGFVFLLIQLVR